MEWKFHAIEMASILLCGLLTFAFLFTEKVREIQEKLEAFIEALHKEK